MRVGCHEQSGLSFGRRFHRLSDYSAEKQGEMLPGRDVFATIVRCVRVCPSIEQSNSLSGMVLLDGVNQRTIKPLLPYLLIGQPTGNADCDRQQATENEETVEAGTFHREVFDTGAEVPATHAAKTLSLTETALLRRG